MKIFFRIGKKVAKVRSNLDPQMIEVNLDNTKTQRRSIIWISIPKTSLIKQKRHHFDFHMIPLKFSNSLFSQNCASKRIYSSQFLHEFSVLCPVFEVLKLIEWYNVSTSKTRFSGQNTCRISECKCAYTVVEVSNSGFLSSKLFEFSFFFVLKTFLSFGKKFWFQN